VKEAEAAAIRIEHGFSTLEDECAEQGRDWRETLAQIKREADERKRLELPPVAPMGRSQQPYASDVPNTPTPQQANA
jgi:capsid protein